jgi:ElaB/YqjD/DUF883 family membrane-anchored ribosome-binding protein
MTYKERSRDATVQDAVDKTGTPVGNFHESGAQVAANVREVAGHFFKASKDQPLTTLGMAAVMGFALGDLWKS